jgi:hypothetical protein
MLSRSSVGKLGSELGNEWQSGKPDSPSPTTLMTDVDNDNDRLSSKPRKRHDENPPLIDQKPHQELNLFVLLALRYFLECSPVKMSIVV